MSDMRPIGEILREQRSQQLAAIPLSDEKITLYIGKARTFGPKTRKSRGMTETKNS